MKRLRLKRVCATQRTGICVVWPEWGVVDEVWVWGGGAKDAS